MTLETAVPRMQSLGGRAEALRALPIPNPCTNVSLANKGALPGPELGLSRPDCQGVQFEPDGYRIALVPFRGGADGALIPTSRLGEIGHLLLLPLTWEDFVARFMGQPAVPKPPGCSDLDLVEFGEVRINFLTLEASRSNRPVSLTAMEFKTLKFFISNPYRVLTRDELLNEVWGYDNYPCTRTVDNRILKLRQKLEKDAAQPAHFHTVHGVGYKFIP